MNRKLPSSIDATGQPPQKSQRIESQEEGGATTKSKTVPQNEDPVIDFSKIETRLFINNEFVYAASGKSFEVINPATEEVICGVQEAEDVDVCKAVKSAKDAFAIGSPWRSASGSKRRDLLLNLADLVERDREYLMHLESLNNGKPLGRSGIYGSSVDLDLTASCYRYYAGWAEKISGSVLPSEGNFLSYTRREPVGVCACIIPWNFPLLMQAWKLGPALACGCTVVLKPSEKTPLSALHVSKLIKEAGFPPGVVNTINGYGPLAGQALARHPDIDKIAFTGSTDVGRVIERIASETNLKRVSLELGGKSPMIIFDDADLESAVTFTHVGVFLNQGQCCCASTRIFVQAGIYDRFVKSVIKKASEVKIGSYVSDSDENPVEQGPQIDKVQFNRIMGYIDKGKVEGAKCEVGGKRHGDQGYFIEPTVFVDVKDDMTIAKEEIFGPVMAILKFASEQEVIDRANATNYGLAAGVFSGDVSRAISVAHKIQAGTVWVNCYDNFDITMPFGGYKESGHGREKGREALESWLETKSVMVPLPGPAC